MEESDSVYVDTLSLSQRAELLAKYAEASVEIQMQLDDLLKQSIKKNPAVLKSWRQNATQGRKKGFTITLGSTNSDPRGSMRDPELIQQYRAHSEQLKKENNSFWYGTTEGKNKRSAKLIEKSVGENKIKIDVEDKAQLQGEELDRIRKLASYVPKLVLRRMFQNTQAIKAPEIETFPAAVVFADISGFTPLTEKLAAQGAEGIERLTTELNKYFGRLIELIHLHGGDIVKFAGDAVLVVWPAFNRATLGGQVLWASQCSKALLNELNDYSVEGTGCILRLHIGVGAGEVSGIHVGGTTSVEYFISGQVLEQVSNCEKEAAPGEVFVSAVAWTLVEKGRLSGTQKTKGLMANYKIDNVDYPADLPVEPQLPIYADMEAQLKMYIQPAVLRHAISGSKRWLAELRNVSVIFLNLTSPFKEYKLQELQQAIINMQAVIEKYEGTVRQFMIDDKGSVLIVGFGLPPKAHNDDPARACSTAIELHEVLSKMSLPCSIGVTTGKAFCGDVGSAVRREYAMVGDIVNLSARLMVASKGGVLCDQDTFDSAKTNKALSFKPLDPIRVKGKTNPINIFIPSKQGKDRKENEKEISEETQVCLFGRENQKKIISQSVLDLKGRNESKSSLMTNPSVFRIQAVMIEGESGTGKTMLLQFAEKLFRENNSKGKILSGCGDQLNTSTPYYPWRDIFETMLDSEGNFPEWVSKDIPATFLPLLNVVLPKQLEETKEIASMSGQLRTEKTREILVKVLKRLATSGTLILLDNIQWFDSASWALISALREIQGILLIAAIQQAKSMPVQYNQLVNKPNTQKIALGNLGEDDVTQLIANRLGVTKVPTEISKEIFAKSRGNPFIAHEITLAIKDFVHPNKYGEMTVTPEIQAALKGVPTALSGLLTAKVDKLSPSLSLILKVGSVIGRSFSVDLLSLLMAKETDKANLQQDLSKLVQAGMIESEPGPHPTYAFTNILIRDAVYNLMMFSQKRDLHKSVADYIIKHFPGNTVYYPALAHHYKSAELYDEAIVFLTKAGSRSLFNFENKEAASFFSEALELTVKLKVSTSLDSIGTARKLGVSYYNLGIFDKADSILREVSELLGVTIPTDESKARSATKPGKKIPFKLICEDPSELSHRKREAVIILLALAKLNYYACNRSIATFCAQLAVQAGESVSAAVQAEALALHAVCAAAGGDTTTAGEHHQKAIQIAGTQLDVLKNVHQFAGMVHASMAKWDDSLASFNLAIDAAKTVGDLRSWEESTVLAGTVKYLQGDLAESVRMTKEAFVSSKSRGDFQMQVLALCAQARNDYANGDNEECLKNLIDIEVAFENVSNGDVSARINYTGLRALMHLHLKNDVQACFDQVSTMLDIFKLKEPTAWFTFCGYIFQVEASTLMVAQCKKDSKAPINKKKLASREEKSMVALSKFSQSFKFVAPMYQMWEGIHKAINGKTNKAEEDFKMALEGSKNLNMKFEEAIVSYEKSIVSRDVKNVNQIWENYPGLKIRGKVFCEIHDWFPEGSQEGISVVVSPPGSPTNATPSTSLSKSSRSDPVLSDPGSPLPPLNRSGSEMTRSRSGSATESLNSSTDSTNSNASTTSPTSDRLRADRSAFLSTSTPRADLTKRNSMSTYEAGPKGPSNTIKERMSAFERRSADTK